MGASLPDSSLLMSGIDRLAATVLQGHPGLAFRMNLVRAGSLTYLGSRGHAMQEVVYLEILYIP